MKILCFLPLLAASTAFALPSKETTKSNLGWHVPQANGSLIWMSETEFQQEAKRAILSNRNAASIKYYLYTTANNNVPQQIDPKDAATLTNSNFNKSVPTRIIIHGWRNDHRSDVNRILRTSLVDTGAYNVISVDWSSKASSLLYIPAYVNVEGVGQRVARFIDFLHQHGGMSFDTLNVIGHSLGAHVAGHAGRNVRNGRISQITGLDPALPGFRFFKKDERLSATDADFVETIQTCGGMLGFLEPIGTAAFYPNGGKSQPGCGMDLFCSCAHSRAYEYYGEALWKNNFPAMKCDSYQDAVDNKCDRTTSEVHMGAVSNAKTAKGQYYVPVNSKPPFGKG